MEWTKADFQRLLVPEVRRERVLIQEFMRVHPDQALAVYELTVTRVDRFRSIVPSNIIVKTIVDIRNMLGYLNIPFVIPSPDPYRIDGCMSRKEAKAVKHRETNLSVLIETQEKYTKKIAETKETLSALIEAQEKNAKKIAETQLALSVFIEAQEKHAKKIVEAQEALSAAKRKFVLQFPDVSLPSMSSSTFPQKCAPGENLKRSHSVEPAQEDQPPPKKVQYMENSELGESGSAAASRVQFQEEVEEIEYLYSPGDDVHR